jgi:hypothetical protein
MIGRECHNLLVPRNLRPKVSHCPRCAGPKATPTAFVANHMQVLHERQENVDNQTRPQRIQ